MCGIGGVAGPAALDVDAAVFDHCLAHRGPDGSGTRAASGDGWAWLLAHRRLSIVDLSDAGLEPIADENDRFVLAFNGEIYNFPELRRYCQTRGHRFKSAMDGEVILHLWELEGPDCLRRLNGIFAIAVADATTGEIVLARDQLGVKPLFYSAERENMWFASEPGVLAHVGAPVGQPDPVALAQFLSFLWVPDPRSPRLGVKSLEPGQALRWTAGRTTLFRYADELVPTPAARMRTRDLVEEAWSHVRAATRRQLQADVPVGLMASGGVDSSLLWKAGGSGLSRAWCISWPRDAGGDERLAEDEETVRQLEATARTPVTYLAGTAAERDVLTPSGDLFADPAYHLTRLIAQSAREAGCKVLLSGQGGDELFGGYRRHVFAANLALPGVWPLVRPIAPTVMARGGGLRAEYASRTARGMAERDPFNAYMQLCTYSSARDRARVLDCDEREVADEVVWQRHREVYDSLPRNLSFLRKALALDLRVYLPGLGLAYVDRAGMEFGVEIRVPWLDIDLVRWSLTLPDRALVRAFRAKWLTRKLASDRLGSLVGNRPKRGFAAPASTLEPDLDEVGDRGFRQGTYLARATAVLRDFLGAPA